MRPLLSVKNLSVSYGKINAVKNVSFNLGEGDFAVLIGANGAGKTSVLKAVSGLIPHGGEILYKGRNISGMAAHNIAALGLRHVPEGRGIFENLTVYENLQLAGWNSKDKKQFARDCEYAFSLFPRLKERKDQPSGTLSGGEQQMLAVARALTMKGDALILDEPSMGLSPILTQTIFQKLSEINKAGTAILLVEQNVCAALKLAAHGYVMETGKIALSGTKQELLNDNRVKEAYLGEQACKT